MKEYAGESIRNVALVGHAGAGKTSLVDALAFVSGSSKRHGSVDDGTALTDYTDAELAWKSSIALAVAYAEWKDTKINLIDTPGYLDFVGDVAAGLHAADAALFVVGATSGVQVGTELAWRLAEEQELPKMFFVSQMDKENADFERVFEDIRDHVSSTVVPIEIPVGEGAEFHGIINLFSKKCHLYDPDSKTGEYREVDVPAEYQERFERYSEKLREAIAELDDELIERFLEGKEITRAEALAALKKGMAERRIVPLLCGSATLAYGTRALLSKLVELMPHPLEAEIPGYGATHEISPSEDGPLTATVFKTLSEKHVGDISLFRIWSGGIEDGSEVWNATHELSEKINHMSVRLGRERNEVPRLHVGDIGSVAKLKDTHTNDTLSREGEPIALPKIEFPEPLVTMAIEVDTRGDEEKLGQALQRLHEEDPTFHTTFEPELHETHLHGRGERHLEVVLDRMKNRFGVSASLHAPSIAYRETFRKTAQGQGRHKKQSGGRGQFGDCWIEIGPQARGEGYAFESAIVGGVIPTKFIPAVDKGVREASERGTIAGYPTVDFKVKCYDGSHHSVDSSDQAFKMAGILAFRTVAPQCDPVLLEPFVEIEILAPEEHLGDVMGDLSSRRGEIMGTDTKGIFTAVTAYMPQSALHRYAPTLHSMTHGRGTFQWRFHGYREAPEDVTRQVVEARAEKAAS